MKRSEAFDEVKTLEKIVIGIVVFVGIASFVLIAFFTLMLFSEEIFTPKPIFSLANPQASYSIFKEGTNYWVSYTNPGTTNDKEASRASLLVGKSTIPLEQFVGKKVKINGKFNPFFQKQQCIINTCHAFGESWQRAVVIDINSLEEVK